MRLIEKKLHFILERNDLGLTITVICVMKVFGSNSFRWEKDPNILTTILFYYGLEGKGMVLFV